jgi:7-carboxy-7-deazaguanine synthase
MRVNEIFDSLEGEYNGFKGAGVPATFVRLQGCNLKCKWCDTPKAQETVIPEDPTPDADNSMAGFLLGEEMSVQEVLGKITRHKVTITGGEPLLQLAEVRELMLLLLAREHYVSIETNGTIPIPRGFCPRRFRDRFRIVMDFKMPSSGHFDEMRDENFASLSASDVVKFVVSDLNEYQLVLQIIGNNHIPSACQCVVSPMLSTDAVGRIDLGFAIQLANELARDLNPICDKLLYSLQLHKLLEIR